MTITSSGVISINSLVGEYGGSTPHAMNEYYRGGSLVANHSNNGNVPTSGLIDLQDFYGANNTSPNDLVCVITVGQSSVKYGEEGYNSTIGLSQFGSISDSALNIGGTSYTVTDIYSNEAFGSFSSRLTTNPAMNSGTLSSFSSMTLTSSGKSGGGDLSWNSGSSFWQWSDGTGDSQFLDHGIGTTVTCTIS